MRSSRTEPLSNLSGCRGPLQIRRFESKAANSEDVDGCSLVRANRIIRIDLGIPAVEREIGHWPARYVKSKNLFNSLFIVFCSYSFMSDLLENVPRALPDNG